MEIERKFLIKQIPEGYIFSLQTDRTGLLKYRSCGPGPQGQ